MKDWKFVAAVVVIVGLLLAVHFQQASFMTMSREILQLTAELDRFRRDYEDLEDHVRELAMEIRGQAITFMVLVPYPAVSVSNMSYTEIESIEDIHPSASIAFDEFSGWVEGRKAKYNMSALEALGRLGYDVRVAAFKSRLLGLNDTEIAEVLIRTIIVHEPYPWRSAPFYIEKANYKGVDAWIIVFLDASLLFDEGEECRYRIYLVECGTQKILKVVTRG